LALVVVRSADDLADLSKSEALGGSSLQERSANFHVFEADGADVKAFVKVSDVGVNVQLGDVLLGLGRKRLICLVKGEPN